MVSRPALRYHGGKFRLAPWITSFCPPHECYVEPYGGGASLLLCKEPSLVEVYNDIDKEVVTFFQILRSRPTELIRAIQLTPYARAEKKLAYSTDVDPLEIARRFYIRCWMGYGSGSSLSDSGWRYQYQQLKGENVVQNWNDTTHLSQIAQRLKLVQIECDDALKVIKRYDTPNTLYFVDPPYVLSTRTKRAYKHELTDDDHRNLAANLHSVSGMVLLSGYDSALYQELYSGWTKTTKKTNCNGSRMVEECLWISPRCQQERLPLFAMQAVQP